MPIRAQLFITCLAEQFYPATLEKMIGLLERLDVEVMFPTAQTCCGQPLFNSGYQGEARHLAANWLETFGASTAPVVSPSGSCVDMVRHHYPELFPEGTPEHQLARDLASRTFEFTEFLVHQLGIVDVGAQFPHRVTYHPSCHLLRGLGLRTEARQLLEAVREIEVVPLPDEEACCGFGGVFSVIFPTVSQEMMKAKVNNIISSGAEAVIACDAGCLMNISGGLSRVGSRVKALHLVDILASGDGAL
jgi:L-lactate dehydrogenase complex protein LldE